jgi:hypothetical protein
LDANDSLLDITAAETLDKLIRELGRRQVQVGLAHVHARQMLQRAGVMATVGADRTFPNLPAAVAWATSAPADQLRTAAGPGRRQEGGLNGPGNRAIAATGGRGGAQPGPDHPWLPRSVILQGGHGPGQRPAPAAVAS